MAGPVSVSGGQVRTPVGDAPVIPLLMIGIGGYLMWFAAHYWHDLLAGNITWPSDPVKSVLQGQGIPAQTATAASGTPATATLTAYEAGIAGAPVPAAPAPPPPASKAAANRARLTAKQGTGPGRRVK